MLLEQISFKNINLTKSDQPVSPIQKLIRHKGNILRHNCLRQQQT